MKLATSNNQGGGATHVSVPKYSRETETETGPQGNIFSKNVTLH